MHVDTSERNPLARTSQIALARMEVSAHPRCHVRLTNTPETSSGEHKVKLTGVMMTHLGAGSPLAGMFGI